MRCPKCREKLSFHKGVHHYVESGLPDIRIEGVDVAECACGEKVVSIPRIPELDQKICRHLISKESLLTGPEIRFLRKNMGLTALKLAVFLGVDNATVSRWENAEKNISKPLDRLIRLIYASITGVPAEEARHLVEDNFPAIYPEQLKSRELTIPYMGWGT